MIPNIYKYNYKLFSLIPIAMLIIAIYFIPQIKLGVEFKGGTLVSIEKVNNYDIEGLKQAFEEKNYEANVKVFNTLQGTKIEVEFNTPEEITKTQKYKNEIISEIEELAKKEANGEDGTELRAKINEKANYLFDLAKLNKKAEDIKNLNDLKDEVTKAERIIDNNYKKNLEDIIKKYVDSDSIAISSVSPALSTQFISGAEKAALFAAIISIITVFFFFRTFVPSLAVIIGALSDIIFALGAMGMFHIPLTLASFAAILMLVGFSLDTDILLTMRMLKRKGDPREKAFDAMKTGTTMSMAAIGSFLVLFIVAYFTRIAVYYEISAVALAGLIGDLFATWGINAVILLTYLEGKR